VGRNYVAHAAELGSEVPDEPLIFLKPPSALVADGDPVVLPADSRQVEYEGEIAVVVGRRARRVPESRALEVLEAVVPLNDVTARDLQRTDDQWTRAKGFDSFCPVGAPVPLDPEAEAWDELKVETRVDGELRQSGKVAEMVFSIPFLVAWVSRVMTLEPGDLLSTGTPAGVGPLRPGSRVRVTVPGIGSVENPVVAPS
jgi:2-keto-4-pentenoate hydratase/2-oxohepta-3-ene-1,7-dioic acid hydratase in catechol pathway